MRKVFVLFAAATALLACTRDATERAVSQQSIVADAGGPVAAPAPVMAEPAPAMKVGAVATLASFTRQSIQSATSMIVRNGSARIEVDSLESALAGARVLAERLGGFVAGVNVSAGNAEFRQATLELRIPAAAFDSALVQLQPLGEVESIQVTAEDVGEDYVDTESRLRNSRRLEERLIDLLAKRTGKLEEVLSVERELARVREEIERTEGHLRYLRARVSLSTLTLNVHESEPLLTQPGANPLVDALLASGRNFVAFIAGFIALLGYAVPAAVLAIGLLLLGKRIRRRWKHGFGVSTVAGEAG